MLAASPGKEIGSLKSHYFAGTSNGLLHRPTQLDHYLANGDRRDSAVEEFGLYANGGKGDQFRPTVDRVCGDTDISIGKILGPLPP